MKRKLLIAVPLLGLVVLVAWLVRPKHESLGEAFVSEKVAPMLSSIAQVRQQVGMLHYGERVEVIGKRNEYLKVRTSAGAVGWVDSHELMDPPLWQRSIKLLEQVRNMPVQARGRTKVSTNLRVLPGRTEPRLYQFGRNVPVEIVGRAVADWAQTTDEKDSGNEPQETRKEDWFLIRAIATRPPGEASARAVENNTTQPGDQTVPIAGWVVARFVELDLPDAVREGAASANIRPLAWFELNRVSDPSGDKPQYLVAAARGPEGQICDFSALRVYTWYQKRSRYETAFIENNLCGQMPIRVDKGPKGEPEFRFRVMDGNKEERVYRLMQTVVRRVREPGDSSGKRAVAKASKPGVK
ncbi:MAG TPA: SH3 domain-containing protein [Candidatus Angelobacter sp.]|nr:SH3 domain-containing protein [Candidatus Angelobacter sp.]